MFKTSDDPEGLGENHDSQWIGLKENLQENHGFFTTKHRVFPLTFTRNQFDETVMTTMIIG